jgi:hypothetical protein
MPPSGASCFARPSRTTDSRQQATYAQARSGSKRVSALSSPGRKPIVMPPQTGHFPTEFCARSHSRLDNHPSHRPVPANRAHKPCQGLGAARPEPNERKIWTTLAATLTAVKMRRPTVDPPRTNRPSRQRKRRSLDASKRLLPALSRRESRSDRQLSTPASEGQQSATS